MALSVANRAVTGGYMGARPMIRAFYKKRGAAEPEIVFGADVPLGPVRNLFASVLGPEITVTWDPVPGAIGYAVDWRRWTSGGQLFPSGTTPTNTTQAGRDGTREAITPGLGTWAIRVAAVGTRGRTGPWNIVPFGLLVATTTAQPRVRAPSEAPGVTSIVGETTATFRVTRPARATRLQYDPGDGIWRTFASPLEETGLLPATGYVYRFRGVNSSGNGPPATVAFTTGEPVPAPTEAPSVDLTASTTAIVATIGAVDRGEQAELRHQPTGGAWSAWDEVTSPHTIGSLTAGTAYTVEARWKNSTGTGPAGSASITTPTTETKPPTPTAVVSDQTTSGAKITGSSAGATKWRLRTHGATAWGAEQSSNVFDLTGLSAGTVQRYEISAGNSAGWSDASEPIDVWTVVGQATATHTRTFTSLTITIAELAGAIRFEYRTADTTPLEEGETEPEGGRWNAWTAIPSGGRVVTLPGLAVGSDHKVQVRGVGNAGPGAHSEYEWATRGEPPTGMTVQVNVQFLRTAGGDALTFEWFVTQFLVTTTLPAGATGWQLRYSEELELNPELDRRRTVTLSGSGRVSHNVAQRFLSTNRIYYVTVRATYPGGHHGAWNFPDVIAVFPYVIPREERLSTGEILQLRYDDLRSGAVIDSNVEGFGDTVEERFRGFNDTVSTAGRDLSDSLDGIASIADGVSASDVSFGTLSGEISEIAGRDMTPGEIAGLQSTLSQSQAMVNEIANAAAQAAAESQRGGGGSLGTGDGYGGNDDSGGGGRGG